jgi:hypothetical protein
MPAIITSKFRLDTTEKFVNSITTTGGDAYYMGLGRPQNWTDESLAPSPYENDVTTNTSWGNMYAMKEIAKEEISFATPNHSWISGSYYKPYDDRDVNIEGKEYYVVTPSNNIYLCIRAGLGSSINNPDDHADAMTTSNIETADDYIWKYLFTIDSTDSDRFLTASFAPVRVATAGGGTNENTNQWNVQTAAANIKGSIFNIIIDNPGADFDTAPTITIDGDGDRDANGDNDFAATAILGSGEMTGKVVLIEVTNPGKNFTAANIGFSGGNGQGLTMHPVIGPKDGFGADARVDLRAHYVAIHSQFNGTENADLLTASSFRQISLIKNPVDVATSAVAEGNAYTTCKALAIALNGAYTAGDVIQGSGSAAQGIVVEFKNDIIYYIQTSSTGYKSFDVNDTLAKVVDGAASGAHAIASGGLIPSEIVHRSGDISFIENRTAVTRGTDQIETIRLVLAF